MRKINKKVTRSGASGVGRGEAQGKVELNRHLLQSYFRVLRYSADTEYRMATRYSPSRDVLV